MLLSPALSTRMRAVDLIRKKRDSGELSHEEIDFLVSGYTRGEIPDYQMAAWLMAAWIRGMNRAELAALTEVMLHSGQVLDHSDIPGKKVDKDRKSTRLNSSHEWISYAVFCLKKNTDT